MPGDEPRILQGPVPDYRVIAVGGRVHSSVVKVQRELQLRMLGKKGIERRSQMHAAEGGRSGNAQGSRQAATTLGHVGNGLFDRAHNACGFLKERRSVLGQAHLAGRSMEQACAQHSLEFGEPLADHGFRQIQASRRLTDLAGFRDGHKAGNAV